MGRRSLGVSLRAAYWSRTGLRGWRAASDEYRYMPVPSVQPSRATTDETRLGFRTLLVRVVGSVLYATAVRACTSVSRLRQSVGIFLRSTCREPAAHRSVISPRGLVSIRDSAAAGGRGEGCTQSHAVERIVEFTGCRIARVRTSQPISCEYWMSMGNCPSETVDPSPVRLNIFAATHSPPRSRGWLPTVRSKWNSQ